MEINFNRNAGGMAVVGLEAGGFGVDAAKPTTGTGSARLSSDLTIRTASSGIASSEPVGEVPESALSRDDELGKLVNFAFNLSAPPMPSFDS